MQVELTVYRCGVGPDDSVCVSGVVLVLMTVSVCVCQVVHQWDHAG